MHARGTTRMEVATVDKELNPSTCCDWAFGINGSVISLSCQPFGKGCGSLQKIDIEANGSAVYNTKTRPVVSENAQLLLL